MCSMPLPLKNAGQGDIIDAHGDDVACVYLRADLSSEEATDRTDRIVACVNACQGISTANLSIVEIIGKALTQAVADHA